MNVLVPLQLAVLLYVSLFAPGSAIVPTVADDMYAHDTAAVIHTAALRPHGTLSSLPGLPPAPDRPAPPTKKDPQNLGVRISAKSALVIDRKTGAVLFTKDADRVHSIASLTKLMTALVVLDTNPDWQKRVTLQASDLRGGGIEYIIPGESVTVEELLSISLVGSSNTATAALARSTGLIPQEFLDRMNQKARELGTNTVHFADPTGLDPDNRGSAKDVARIVQAAFAYPKILAVVRTPTFSFTPTRKTVVRPRIVKSTDLLLGGMLNKGGYQIVGGKTGTLGEETGYHLAVVVSTAEGSQEILVVVLGSVSNADRFQDAKALSVWAFEAYEWK